MLRWPPSWERTPFHVRSAGSLGFTRQQAEQGLLVALGEMGARDVQLTCNDLWRDASGLVRQPEDPGVALWFVDAHGDTYALACDSYMTVRDNIGALYQLCEQMRRSALMGASTAVAKMFMGLITQDTAGDPARVDQVPTGAEAQWWHVFGYRMAEQATLDECERKYRAAVKKVALCPSLGQDEGGFADGMTTRPSELTAGRPARAPAVPRAAPRTPGARCG